MDGGPGPAPLSLAGPAEVARGSVSTRSLASATAHRSAAPPTLLPPTPRGDIAVRCRRRSAAA